MGNSNELKHWLSFKQRMLPFLGKATFDRVDLVQLYREALLGLTDLDYPLFLQTALADILISPIKVPSCSDTQLALFRLVLEEAYAVLTFEKCGCRVIRPSLRLVEMLMNVDVTWRLADICPPYSHVYVELPEGCSLSMLDVTDMSDPGNPDKQVLCRGIYVSWMKASEACRQSLRNTMVVDKAGSLAYKNSVPIDSVSDTDPALVYGDWSSRLFAVAGSTGRTHDWTSQYFNLRWADQSEEMAEGALQRFEGTWFKKNSFHAVRNLAAEEVIVNLRSRVFHIVCNLFLWMSQPGAESDIEHRPASERVALKAEGHHWNNKRRKRMRERLFNEMPPDVYTVGQHIVIDTTNSTSDNNTVNLGGKHASPKAHWRRGHWHKYWVGPREGERTLVPKLLRPILVCGGAGEPASTTVMEVR